MKKQLQVYIHSLGFDNDSILKMVANSNSGKHVIGVDTIAFYLNARKAEVPGIYKKKGWILDEENKVLDIWEDTDTNFTLHIEEHEVFEIEDDTFYFTDLSQIIPYPIEPK